MNSCAAIPILSVRVSPLAAEDVSGYCLGLTGPVVFANTHVVMSAWDSSDYRSCVSRAALVLPDGWPVAWMLRRLGARGAQRLAGPDVAESLCAAAAEMGISIGLLGGRPTVLQALANQLPRRYPGLRISYAYSPPFHALTDDEWAAIAGDIRGSGCRLLFVGLGCPKQERWMDANRDLPCAMFGVGAWFDFAAGAATRAPRIFRRIGLEWFHRLMADPKRLAGRYAWTIPRFLVLSLWQLLTGTHRAPAAPHLGSGSELTRIPTSAP